MDELFEAARLLIELIGIAFFAMGIQVQPCCCAPPPTGDCPCCGDLGTPSEFHVVIAGVVNEGCEDCETDFNDVTFVLDLAQEATWACAWVGEVAYPGVTDCFSSSGVETYFFADCDSDVFRVVLDLGPLGGFGGFGTVVWSRDVEEGTDLCDGQEYELTFFSWSDGISDYCDFSASTATIQTQ